MLVRQGEARSHAADRRLACSLAAIAGALNTAGFYATGYYSSHMTGNTSSLADRLALGDLALAAPYIILVLTFILGAGSSALLLNISQRRRLAAPYALSVLVEAALLAGLGCADLWFPTVSHGPLLPIGLAFLMGLQNAVVTRISDARVRTTHVSGMVTDIGIELGNLADIALQRGSPAQAAVNREKLVLHVQTVLSFLGGGIAGVLGYQRFGAFALLAAALLLAALALPAVARQPVRSSV